MKKISAFIFAMFFVQMTTGCATNIQGGTPEPAAESVSVSTQNSTDGSLIINQINGTSLADVTRLMRFKLLYPSTVYMQPGTYNILVRHEGGRYRPIESLLQVTLAPEHDYLIKNTIKENKMFFWVEESDTGKRVAGWTDPEGV